MLVALMHSRCFRDLLKDRNGITLFPHEPTFLNQGVKRVLRSDDSATVKRSIQRRNND